jgi:hypothetical protein
MPVTVY